MSSLLFFSIVFLSSFGACLPPSISVCVCVCVCISKEGSLKKEKDGTIKALVGTAAYQGTYINTSTYPVLETR